MSIPVNNEVDRLFSLAFGTQWISAGLLARTCKELKEIDTLASNNADGALDQIAAIGNVLGAQKLDEMETTRLGWVVAHLAEYASVANFIAETAQELQDPEIRALNERVVGAKG